MTINNINNTTTNWDFLLIDRYIPFYMAAVGEQASNQTAATYTDGLITLTKPDKSKAVFGIFDKAAIQAQFVSCL
jgi:hypothetical protein